MTQIATYSQARSLKHALSQFGIVVKPETFEMTTSGIYIPRWEGYSRIPHEFDPETGIAKWYFFLRFEFGHADVNVGEAMDFSDSHGMMRLSHRIKNNISLTDPRPVL
jgi:hypothetical protein